MVLDAGMIFASDSRTNAGVDQIATFRKMRTFERPQDRVIAILSSGNLAVTQSAINLLDQRSRAIDDQSTVWNVRSMFDVAALLGDALRDVRGRDGPYLAQSNVDASASFIVGGQIAGEQQRLFNVYSEGNFIEATRETPFFQIGETKYGRPIIDRVINAQTDLLEAAKCLLVSFDSTMRSNISVGLPIDLLCYKNDTLHVSYQRTVGEGDPYFSMIHNQWGAGLRKVFAELPNPYWDDGSMQDSQVV
ncbi:MAG: peptidase [Rhodospirillales bacterium]